MDILKIKNEDGTWTSIPAIIGPKGDKGDKGDPGVKGTDGTNGTNGIDGFAPVATVTETPAGGIISIKDKNGTTTATIKNGERGPKGDSYILTAQDKQEIVNEVLAALPNGNEVAY